jgi:flagellar motor switch protein FliM
MSDQIDANPDPSADPGADPTQSGSSTRDVLSPAEIDALLDGVDRGEIETTEDYRLRDNVARAIDLTAQERIVRGRMPTLEMIGNRFNRAFRVSLFNLLRRSVDVSFQGVRMIKFGEYAQSLPVPTSLNLIRMPPLRGTALVVLDTPLVSALVNTFFGGDPRLFSHIEGREFTPMETRVIEMTLEQIFRDMEEAWSPVMAVTFESGGAEVNPQFANIVSPVEVVVVARFALNIDGANGEIHLAMPYAMLEPIREVLDSSTQSDRTDRDERWAASIREDIGQAEVEVHATLAEARITLGKLLRLKAGDVVPIELPETVVLCCEKVPVFRASVGVSNGANAVQIVEQINTKSTR